jgi:hypothetical protein
VVTSYYPAGEPHPRDRNGVIVHSGAFWQCSTESFHAIFSTFVLDPPLQQHARPVVRKPDSSCHIISGDTLSSGKNHKNDRMCLAKAKNHEITQD